MTALAACARLSLCATAAGALLVIAPAAQAGWTASRTLRSTSGDLSLTQPAVALKSGGRGSIIAQRPATPTAAGVVAQGGVRGGRVGRLSDVLPGSAVAYAPSPAGGAAFIALSPSGAFGFFRDPGAPVSASAPLGLSTAPRLAVNARGDSVIARTSPAYGEAAVVVIRPAGGAPSAPIVVSGPGRAVVWDVAIGARGHVAVMWNQGGILRARVREPNGSLSPVALLTAAGTQVVGAAIAVDSRGVSDVALAVATVVQTNTYAALIAAHRPAGGAFGVPVALDTANEFTSLEAVAAGASSLVSWLHVTNNGPPEYTRTTRIHAAARRGDGVLRRVAVRAARGGESSTSDPRPALAPDGSALIASTFGGSVHVARRPAGRRVFALPRVITPIGGGQLPYPESGPTVAAATGGRGLVAWSGVRRQAVSVLAPRARDRSGPPRARPPRMRSTRPLLDLGTTPATMRATVVCDGPCRVLVIVRVDASTDVTLRVRRVLPRGGRIRIAERVSASQDRRLRRRAIKSIRTTVSVTNRWGATVRRVR